MNLTCNHCKSVAALVAASCLTFAASVTARGESPKSCFPGESGTACPILLTDLNWSVSYFYSANANDFIRTNPDGSLWWHEQGANVPISVAYWDEVNQVDEVRFVGNGKFKLGCTAVMDENGWLAADGRRFEYRIEATLTDLATGEEYPFFFHWVIKDWVWLVDDLRFAPAQDW